MPPPGFGPPGLDPMLGSWFLSGGDRGGVWKQVFVVVGSFG